MSFAWDRPPRVIGHRGAPREAPENTLPSFRACLRDGVRAVELDARLSRDGRVVVHHDAALGRVVPGDAFVAGTESEALRALGIPLLEEVLALDLLVNVELKADAPNADELPRRALDV
ncbi:MAG TPA: glycerophosphodiester phosphodiesterase, partial [Candidatus Thermoplasmatota archaeon]|nr:glycerophosphodiester phosphodiesterase [Candidatus Thermoplasmatota archaeon]